MLLLDSVLYTIITLLATFSLQVSHTTTLAKIPQPQLITVITNFLVATTVYTKNRPWEKNGAKINSHNFLRTLITSVGQCESHGRSIQTSLWSPHDFLATTQISNFKMQHKQNHDFPSVSPKHTMWKVYNDIDQLDTLCNIGIRIKFTLRSHNEYSWINKGSFWMQRRTIESASANGS